MYLSDATTRLELLEGEDCPLLVILSSEPSTVPGTG